MTRSSGRALALILVLLVLLGGAAAGGYYWLQQQFFAHGGDSFACVPKVFLSVVRGTEFRAV